MAWTDHCLVALLLSVVPLLSGSSAVLRSDVSVPLLPMTGARYAPPLAKSASFMWHIGGQDPGVRLDVPGVGVEVHLVNRNDRTMFAGPFLLVPLPVTCDSLGPSRSRSRSRSASTG